MSVAIVYQAINQVNGKRYIGVTSRTLSQRESEHRRAALRGNGGCLVFRRAIAAHGIDAFKFSTLVVLPNIDAAFDMECRIISAWKPEYNMTKGGDGILGFKMSAEVLAKRSLCPSPLKGIPRTPDVVAKMSAANKGRKLVLTAENIEVRRRQAAEMRARRTGIPSPKLKAHASAMGLSRGKPVVCLNDGLEFPSAAQATRFYRLKSVTAVHEIAGGKNRQTRTGLRFAWAA